MNIAATNWVTIRAMPGQAHAVGAMLAPMLEQLRGADGCLSYIATQSAHDPDRWSVVGNWSGQRHMNAHFQHRALEAYGQLLQGAIIQSIGFDCLLLEEPEHGA